MKRCVYRGVIDNESSYGFHSQWIIRGLTENGWDVHTLPVSMNPKSLLPASIVQTLVRKVQQDPWELICHAPNFTPKEKKRMAYITMWESTRLPPRDVELMNKCEVIMVPSNWNISIFSAQGVKTPMRRVPMGIDVDVYHYTPFKKKDAFVFGTAGNGRSGGCRKNFEAVVSAFRKAFPKSKDVELWVKAYPGDKIDTKGDSRIKVIAKLWEKPQVKEWYSDIDCFVSASRGEGWGLMQHEAMAMGRPVIAVPFGGLGEFFNESIGYAVDYRLVPAGGTYANCGLWADPDIGVLSERMREVKTQFGLAQEKGLRGSRIAAKYSWEHSNKLLSDTLKDVGFNE